MDASQYWAEKAEHVQERLKSERRGLTQAEAKRRLEQYGENELQHIKPRSDLRLLLDQFASPLVILLLAACALSLYLKHYSDAVFIGVFLLLNASVGFYQERKAAVSLLSLQKLVRIRARVIREGQKMDIDSAGLVPGDIIELSAGDKVPADARILVSKSLTVDESALTGEWLAVEKSVEPVAANVPLAERSSALYMSTVVESGTTLALVVATDSVTEIGRIAAMLRETTGHKTPLQRSVATLARIVGGGIISLLLIILFLGELRGADIGETFVASIALAVSAIPAGLLPAVTVILSLGMRRILKENALVRNLVAGETLGSVTVICTDKTGTLTEAKMEVSRILSGAELFGRFEGDEQSLEEARLFALRAAVLGTEGFIENPKDEMHEWIVRGRATERAIVLAAESAGIARAHLERRLPLRESVSFSSDWKFSAVVRHIGKEERDVYCVGAPEILLERSEHVDLFGKSSALDDAGRQKLSHELDTLAATGLRVVAVCSRRLHAHEEEEQVIEHLAKKLSLIAFIALKDPIRADAREAVTTVGKAGIRTLIVTGDHPLTAQAIAREVGLEAKESATLTGVEIETMEDSELNERVKRTVIYARVSPAHKLRIVTALQKNGEVVAFVGDGVNDAPALKAADVGVAIGSGTDLAKEVADIILLDDNFSAIGKAVREGRVMFSNIRKVFAYLIGDDLSELSLFFFALLFGMPLPLLPAQILWINLVEDGFPVVGLTLEEEEGGVMRERPRRDREGVVNKPLLGWLIAICIITGITSLFTYFVLYIESGNIAWTRSMLFALLSLDSLVFSFSVRSLHQPLFHRGMFKNKVLTGALIFGILATFAGLYLPPFQMLLSTVALSPADLFIVAGLVAIEIGCIESYKKLYFGKK